MTKPDIKTNQWLDYVFRWTTRASKQEPSVIRWYQRGFPVRGVAHLSDGVATVLSRFEWTFVDRADFSITPDPHQPNHVTIHIGNQTIEATMKPEQYAKFAAWKGDS